MMLNVNCEFCSVFLTRMTRMFSRITQKLKISAYSKSVKSARLKNYDSLLAFLHKKTTRTTNGF